MWRERVNDVSTHERPSIRALVCYPVGAEPECWTDAAFVSLELAADLHTKGYLVLVDPQDERDVVMYDRLLRSLQAKQNRR